MLDDDAGGHIKALDAFPCGIGIGNVVVAQLFALQLLGGDQRTGRGEQVPVQRGLLVRVFAVAQVLQLDKASIALRGEQVQLGYRIIGHAVAKLHGRQIIADGTVVLADAVECSHAE